jgi:CIC family chloride channel protein
LREFRAFRSLLEKVGFASDTSNGVTSDGRARQQRLIIDALLLGVVGAAGAQLFMYVLRLSTRVFLGVIARYQPPGLPSEGGALREVIGPYGLWLIPVVTTLGGLIVGFLVERYAPEAEGHGTDAVVRAFHRSDGVIRTRVPPIKLLASAITIGSGGSAGREGPIALVAAGVGSWYATITGRDGRDRRLLMLTGMAAGLSAIFRSPIGTALMAIEVLYADMEFEAGALLYALLASIVAYALNGFVDGWEPLFRLAVPIGRLPSALDYGWYVVLGVAAGITATIVPVVFYRTRDLFRASRIPPVLRPAVGGLLAGLIAVAVPQVVGGGYGWMQLAIDGRLALGTLLVLVVAKWVATSLSVASGGSGGVFAPSLYVGAMLGGAWAAVVHEPPAPFVIVGMAAVFAGAAHVPIATLMMVTEMTGGYTLLVPAALAVIISYLVQMRLSDRLKYRSLYEAQVASRAESPAHHSHHLEIAMRILREHRPQELTAVGEIDLVALLRSGIPVELATDRRLVVGVLRPDSRYVGTTVAASGRQLDGGDANIIAILRGEHMMVPNASTRFEAGDRLILVTSGAGADRLKRDVAPW